MDVEAGKQTAVTFQSEALTDELWAEAMPLILANAHETAVYGTKNFAPTKERLQKLEQTGFLRVFTARRNGKLVGYQIFFVLFEMDYPDNLVASCKSAYVQPDSRGYLAGKFLLWADAKLEREGVYSIDRQSTEKRPIPRVYERMGYRKVEENWRWVRGGDC